MIINPLSNKRACWQYLVQASNKFCLQYIRLNQLFIHTSELARIQRTLLTMALSN